MLSFLSFQRHKYPITTLFKKIIKVSIDEILFFVPETKLKVN